MRRWLGLVIAAVAVTVGGFSLAFRGSGDPGDDPAAAPGPTAPGATDHHVHRPGEDGMTEAIVPALACAPRFADGAAVATVPSGAGAEAPGVATPAGPPTATCLETGTGCVVSFSLRWSDGYVEGASRAADAPGTYTLTGERGAEARFTVTGEATCTDPVVTYRTAWPAP